MSSRLPSTQNFIGLKNVDGNVVILKDGGLRQIVLVSGLNLDLQSEEERGSVLELYQRFLNSLDFPVQILVHSRKFNIVKYISHVEEREKIETNELLKNQIFEYKQFISDFVKENDIMTKIFLVVVPFNPVNLVPQSGFISRLFKRPFAAAAESASDQEHQLNVRQLRQRADQVIDGLQSIGLRAVVLESEELLELYYNFYNPESVEKERLGIAASKPNSS